MQNFIHLEVSDGVALLKLNNPAERNALSTQNQWDELVDTIELVQANTDVRCLVLTGEGTAFCAGGNVKDMRDKRGILAGGPAAIRDGYRRGIQQIPLAMARLDVPAIAAVNGAAIGAGCDLACMCDIRIASRRAIFAESFVRLGIVPGDGGAWLLQRVVGYSAAAELAFTGRTIDSETALRLGLVSRVVDDAVLLTEAMSLANEIACNSGPALRMTKRLMREAQQLRLETILEMSAAMQALAHNTPEHAQAVELLIQKMDRK